MAAALATSCEFSVILALAPVPIGRRPDVSRSAGERRPRRLRPVLVPAGCVNNIRGCVREGLLARHEMRKREVRVAHWENPRPSAQSAADLGRWYKRAPMGGAGVVLGALLLVLICLASQRGPNRSRMGNRLWLSDAYYMNRTQGGLLSPGFLPY